MMKLSRGERIGLVTGLSKSFLLFIILSDFIFPQIPFKGFCRLTTFKVDSGYTRIFSLNYDKDEYADLLVYNPQELKASLYHGFNGLNFELKRNINFPLQPSRIEPIIGKNNMIEDFAFTSRKSRAFGIYKFTIQGNPELIHQIKFNSYPENISIADINGDDKPEFLLSGNSFDGLSIIQYDKSKLVEDKILQGKTFLNAQFMDLNSDDVKDIAALNSVDNTIHLLFNNGRGEFTELRTINLSDDALALRIFDLNYDTFPDIIVSTKSSIKIYFGDPTHSYQNVVSIETPSSADDFVIGDFNRDGYFDFNCLSKSDGKIFTIFAKDFTNYYTEFFHTQKDGNIDLIPFFSRFVYGSAFINKNGEVNILSKIISLSDEQTLAIGISPGIISKFDLTDNGIMDLMFIDNFDQAIKFIVRDASGLPEKLFSVHLSDDHQNILVFNNSKLKKTFYFYSYNKRMIEALEVDFQNFTFKRDFFYTDGPILNLVINPDNSGNAEIFVLYSKNLALNLEIFSKTFLRYNKRSYTGISSDWLSPSIISTKDILLGYWNFKNQYLNFYIVDINPNKYETSVKNRIEGGDYLIFSESNNDKNINNNTSESIVVGNEGIFVLNLRDEYKIYSQKPNKYELRITDKNQLFFDKTNSIFVNDRANKDFYRIKLVKSKNQLLVEKLFTDVDISNFIVTNLDQRNNHLIYTDGKQLSINQLPK